MNAKRFLSAALAIAMLGAGVGTPTVEPTGLGTAITASAETYGDYEYEIIDDSVSIKKYTGLDNEIEIPSAIGGKSVTSIGYGAFSGRTSITNITIPDSVTNIDTSAFAGCTSLTSITIPRSVVYIGNSVFRCCENLTSIDVDSNNSFYCSVDGVLFNKNMTNLHTYPAGKEGTSYTIPHGVTSINWEAFCECISLTSINIPDSVTSIDIWAFYGCAGLTSIAIS